MSTPIFSSVQRDSVAGIIVFLIALPLCLGIAQASGAPPFSGIVSGIIGGIVVGLASRSNVSVSGPAAGLIAIVAGALVQQKMAFNIFLCAVMLAGAFQLVLGFLRAGGFANYFPSSVIEGMLAGIGLTIILKEVPNALGYAPSKQHEAFTEGERSFDWSDITHAWESIEPAAVLISIVGLTILSLWMTRHFRGVQLLPAGLVVVVFATTLNQVLINTGGGMAALTGERLVNVPVPADFNGFLGQFALPDWHGFLQPSVWMLALVIAAVASIETLLCIEATDKLDELKRYTPGSEELKAQGLGNMIAGLIGGLPITSVIVRSSANINAGARTKLSTVVHGILLLVAVLTIGTLINRIPKAALSTILIFTGYRLCRPATFMHMWKEGGLTHFIPFVVTAGLVVVLGLLNGVAVGLGIAIIFTLRENMRIPYFFQRSVYRQGELIKLTLAQEVSFLNKAAIKRTLDRLPEGSNVIIDSTQTLFIDFDVLDVIRDFASTSAAEKNIKVSLVGFQEVYKVPKTLEVSELVEPFADAPEVPERISGGHEELLEHLGADEEPADAGKKLKSEPPVATADREGDR